jgi:hypothetical protein
MASKQLHIINEESDRFNFNNNRGSSNIDLTITNNNLITAVSDWEISAEESLSDHNYLKFKIGVGGANSHNSDNKCLGIKHVLKENKLHEFDRKLVQQMRKMANNQNIEGGAKALDKYLSTIITTTESDLELHTDLLAEALQSASRRTFQNTNTGKKSSKKKSVPWWTDSLTLMQKRVNAHRRLYQRTRNDEVLRESRKQKYVEAKRTYQAGNKKEKCNSWKEYCTVAASTNPWSQDYKLTAGKTHANNIMTTLRKSDGSETSSIQETMEVMLEYHFTEDREEETQHHKNIRKTTEEPINTSEDAEFSREEIRQIIVSFNDK